MLQGAIVRWPYISFSKGQTLRASSALASHPSCFASGAEYILFFERMLLTLAQVNVTMGTMKTAATFSWMALALMTWLATTEPMLAQAAQKAIATMSLQSASRELKDWDSMKALDSVKKAEKELKDVDPGSASSSDRKRDISTAKRKTSMARKELEQAVKASDRNHAAKAKALVDEAIALLLGK